MPSHQSVSLGEANTSYQGGNILPVIAIRCFGDLPRAVLWFWWSVVAACLLSRMAGQKKHMRDGENHGAQMECRDHTYNGEGMGGDCV